MKNQGKSSLFDEALSSAVKDFAKEMSGKNGNQNDTDTKNNSDKLQPGLSSGKNFEVHVNQSPVGTRRASLLFLLFTIPVY